VSDRKGFTLIEVLVAVVVLSVGIVALVGSAGAVTRMIGRGKASTIASHVAARRLETLRQQALATNPRCTALANGTGTAELGMTEAWTITTPVGLPTTRTLQATVTYRTGNGRTATANLVSIIRCS
jgi:type IV pilus assembly protein PilV